MNEKDTETLLSNALEKKNQKIEDLTQQLESQKKSYEDKVKNLMNSIKIMKERTDKIEKESADNERVNIIKDLRNERRDQENVILLLKKKLNNDTETDKYLIKEFTEKNGNNRIPTYEELKIKIKKLEVEIFHLKKNNEMNKKTLNEKSEQLSEDNFSKKLSSDNLKKSTERKNRNSSNNVKFMSGILGKVKKDVEFKEIINNLKENYESEAKDYREKIESLQNNVDFLTESNAKLVKMQNEVFNKLKSYNSEIGEMKSVYETMQENLKNEYEGKIKKQNDMIIELEEELKNAKKKVDEVIKISNKNDKENKELCEKLNNENELLKKILQGKKQEVELLDSELNRLKDIFENHDTKGLIKTKKLEKETDIVKVKLKECLEKIDYLEKTITKKDHDIDQYIYKVDELKDIISDKDLEIELLSQKLEELEEMTVKYSIK